LVGGGEFVPDEFGLNVFNCVDVVVIGLSELLQFWQGGGFQVAFEVVSQVEDL
jgi:hypothetical protein